MKATVRLCVLLLAAFLLFACKKERASTTAVTATVMDGEHYAVEVGSVSVEPGESAAFLVQTDPGFMVASTDYRGESRVTQEHGLNKVELMDVRYPTRVRLHLTRYAVTVEYLANGGEAMLFRVG